MVTHWWFSCSSKELQQSLQCRAFLFVIFHVVINVLRTDTSMLMLGSLHLINVQIEKGFLYHQYMYVVEQNK